MREINLTKILSICAILLMAFYTAVAGKIIYVDDDTAGANNGSNWENAYTYLQDALIDANESEKPVEIWVAQGIYKPDQGENQPPSNLGDQPPSNRNQTPNNWKESFQLINGVTLKGGYAGFGQQDPNMREIELYETILSGDLNGDDTVDADPCDLIDEPTRADNSLHVVTSYQNDETAVLDGCTISGGHAVRRPGRLHQRDLSGGGMSNEFNSNPTLIHCTFIGNSAHYAGGGMYNDSSISPTLTDCTFIGNSAYHAGGGMYNCWSSPTLTDCRFIGNWAGAGGGGMYNKDYSSPRLTNCTFSRNSADYVGQPYWAVNLGGGGMNNESGSSPILTNCTFKSNWAVWDGGGMASYYYSSNPTLTNCIFSGNSADWSGGGMYNMAIDSTLTNCIFSGNSAHQGGGMYNSTTSSSNLTNCTFSGNSADYGGGLFCSMGRPQHNVSNVEIVNCILWNGGNEIWNDKFTISIHYSDLQGGQAGIYDPCDAVVWCVGNIDVDPLFVEPGYWADVNDLNIVVEPNNQNAVWVDGDYHLKSQGGRWDPNSESWVVDDVTSPCIDVGDPDSPIGDELEPNGGRINMGAYGGTAEASKSP